MTASIKTAINDICMLAKEYPKKYCRIFWYPDTKMVILNDCRIPICKALLIYQEDSRKIMINASETQTQFILLCRPKKHMAFIMNDEDQDDYYKVFDLNGKSSDVCENYNSEIFVCVLETTSKDTIILSYSNGIYFLQTFDSEYSVTLYSVIRTLLDTTTPYGKEVCCDEEKEERNTQGLLGIN